MSINNSKSLNLNLSKSPQKELERQKAELLWVDKFLTRLGILTISETETFKQAFNYLFENNDQERFEMIVKELEPLIVKAKKRKNPKAWLVAILKKNYGVVF